MDLPVDPIRLKLVGRPSKGETFFFVAFNGRNNRAFGPYLNRNDMVVPRLWWVDADRLVREESEARYND